MSYIRGHAFFEFYLSSYFKIIDGVDGIFKANYFCYCLCSLVYFDVEVLIDGEVFTVGIAISEQYSLHKFWPDVKDAYWGHPSRDANRIKVQVMFPMADWATKITHW